MQLSVGIIGAGWLGKALAERLQNSDINVKTTTRSQARFNALQSSNIAVEMLDLPFVNASVALHDLAVFKQDVLVICIPPQLKKGRVDYPEKIKQLVESAKHNAMHKVILVSTTAIYNGLEGDIDENVTLDYQANKVALLAEGEEHLQKFTGLHYTLRLAGLIGETRHPGLFFKGNRTLSEPDVCVNLIHQADVVGLMMGLITQNIPSGIYNGVCRTHMSKGEFYKLASQSLECNTTNDLEHTKLNTEQSHEKKHFELQGKKIIGENIRQKLTYTFMYDDLLSWLKESNSH